MKSEYPDLPFVESRAWGTGRDGKAVRYIVIHYTAGSERSTSAEDGAAYDQRRTDGTSTHYFVDRDSVVQCVLTRNRANAARSKGNRLGIQYELCGTVQTREEWLDAASLPTLRNAARQVARDCRKYAIPVRRLTVEQTRASWYDFPDGPKGIVGHVDCTRAYPEDGGDHTDPGTFFPWLLFLDMVRDELKGEIMADVTGFTTAARAVLQQEATDGSMGYKGGGLPTWEGEPAAGPNFLNAFSKLFAMVEALQADVALLALQADVALLVTDPDDAADPEGLPLVRAARYVAEHPPAA